MLAENLIGLGFMYEVACSLYKIKPNTLRLKVRFLWGARADLFWRFPSSPYYTGFNVGGAVCNGVNPGSPISTMEMSTEEAAKMGSVGSRRLL